MAILCDELPTVDPYPHRSHQHRVYWQVDHDRHRTADPLGHLTRNEYVRHADEFAGKTGRSRNLIGLSSKNSYP